MLRNLSALLACAWVISGSFSQAVSAQDSARESVARGKILFTRRACASCHALDGKTDSLGPNLGKLEKKLSRSEVIESILHPSKEIKKGYESTVVVTDSGRVVTGRLLADNAKVISLLVSAEGKIARRDFSKQIVDEILNVPTSIMPVDLLNGLTQPQIDDLLAYLVSLEVIDPSKKNKPVAGAHAHHQLPTEYEGPDDRLKFDRVDHEVTIGVIPKKMQYDVEIFDVKPGARVKLTLKNPDEMQHNLFICGEGKTTWLEVAKAAWALGADGPRLRYVPKSEKVLHHTRLVNPGSSDSIYFEAPKKEGVYPYVCTIPGHAFLMRGEMHVLAAERGLAEIEYRLYHGRWQKLPDFNELTPVKTGTHQGIVPDFKRLIDVSDNFGLVFEGTLNVAVAGEYTFYLDSDDGSKILVDAKAIVDRDGVHPDGDPAQGKVKLTPGAHDFRLEFFEAGGGEVLHAAWSGPGFKILPLTDSPQTLARLGQQTSFELAVESQPRIIRANMPQASSRAIAVGLIGGMNFCFDASTCHVLYGWPGDFLNVGPERGFGRNRGGGTCKPLGPLFTIASRESPWELPGNPQVRFRGYRRSLLGPTFLYSIGDTLVQQQIEASDSGRGLRMNFRFEPPLQTDLSYRVDGENLRLESSHGSWQASRLTIPSGDTASFSITVEPQP